MLFDQVLHNHFHAIFLEEFVPTELNLQLIDDFFIILLVVVNRVDKEHILAVVNHEGLVDDVS